MLKDLENQAIFIAEKTKDMMKRMKSQDHGKHIAEMVDSFNEDLVKEITAWVHKKLSPSEIINIYDLMQSPLFDSVVEKTFTDPEISDLDDNELRFSRIMQENPSFYTYQDVFNAFKFE